MDQPRSHTPIIPAGGQLYIFGGGGPNFKSLNATHAFDPTAGPAGQWQRRADMPTARSGTIGCSVDGKIYIIGGGFKQPDGMFRFLNTVEIYDPIRDTWEAGPDMLMPHDYPGGLLMGDYIYILGGHHPDATRGGPKTDPGFDFCERLNLKTGQWEEIAPLPTPRFALSAVVYNDQLLTMGGVAFTPEGFNNFTVIERYDPTHNRWTTLTDLALPWTAAGQANIVLRDRLYTFGGYSGDGIHHHAAYFDAATREWVATPEMPAPRAAMGITILNDTIYLVGGWEDDRRAPVDTLFTFTPAD